MPTIIEEELIQDSLAELWDRLGRVPLERIRLKPLLGTATEADLITAAEAPRKRLCELIEGVLVEKAMGVHESILAGVIIHYFWTYLTINNLGVVIGADGPIRISPTRVRTPDVSFISWDRMPDGELPEDAISSCIPELAVEVISKGNTKREMRNKIDDYFEAGVLLVWLIDPKTQTVEVHESAKKKTRLGLGETLDGGTILPDFTLPLDDLFHEKGRKGRKK